MLPNELLLIVLYFADYKTLVFTKFSESRFLRLIEKFAAEELARRRSFRVDVSKYAIEYKDLTIGAGQSILFECFTQQSLAAACRDVARTVGPHAVARLALYESTLDLPGAGVIFEAAPPLKYAEEVVLHCPYDSIFMSTTETFMSNYVGMKSLFLCVHSDILRQFNWSFLRQECARELRLVKLLKNSGCEVTFRMRIWQDDELVLDESEYAVDVDGTTKRYVSEKSGIVVEVKGRWVRCVAIKSTAEVPRKKVHLGTIE